MSKYLSDYLPLQLEEPWDGEDPRLTFLAFLDSSEDPSAAQVGESQRSIQLLVRQLETCQDILPALYCAMLEIPEQSSYSDALHKIRRDEVD